MMEALRLRTLGELRLEGPDCVLLGGPRRREIALLAYLAHRAPRAVAREELATLFWGERDESKARHSLRQLLFKLRRVLGSRLEVSTESARLVEGGIAHDAAAFEADVSGGRVAEAIEWYKGEFLHGAEDVGGEAFRDWVDAERARLSRLHESALARWVDDAFDRGDWVTAEQRAHRWAELRPLEEGAVVRLLDALERQGRHVDAQARRDAFTARLRNELGTEPASHELRSRPSVASERGIRRPASAARLTPDLVGRHGELTAIDGLWSELAECGAGALIEGEPGIGKSRLLREFIDAQSRKSANCLLLSVRPDDRDSVPFAAARRLLAPLRFAPGVSAASNHALARLSALVPSLRDRFLELPPAPVADDSAIDALREVLRFVGEEVPVIIAADDVPRLDEPSRALVFGLLSRRCPNILVLLAARTDELRGLGRLSDVESSPVLRASSCSRSTLLTWTR